MKGGRSQTKRWKEKRKGGRRQTKRWKEKDEGRKETDQEMEGKR